MLIISWLAVLLMGLVFGLLGAGGAILTIPILVYLMDIPGQSAVVYSYAIVGAMSILASVPGLWRRQVSFPALLWLGIPSVLVLSLCRRFVTPAIPEILFRSGNLTLSHDTATMLVFSLVVAWSAWRMLGPSTLSEKVKEHSPLRLLATGLMLGLLTGLLGVGGGFIIIPALVLFLGLDMNIAVNTSLSIISLNTLFGLISSIDDLAALDAGLSLRIIGIATIGMMAGVAFRHRMPAARLKQIFAWMLLSLAVLIFLKEGFELLG